MDSRVIERIRNETSGAAEYALDVITFDSKFQPAISSVFGGWFICRDRKTAKEISMQGKFGQKFNCVTL